MSISIEGEKCPVCGAYLFDEDDVVFCPECGAKQASSNACSNCGAQLNPGAKFCPECGTKV